MRFTSNTVTIEVDRDTTIEFTGRPRTGRTEMTVHQVIDRQDNATTASITNVKLTDEVRSSLIDALEMMR